jgi:predicted dienelactone hydrolase
MVGRYHVRTRTLDLTDPSRTTDPTPGQPGDEVAGRHLPTTVWYPTGRSGPFPVVVFSHGTHSLPAGYADLLTGWASAGMVVVAPTFPLTNRDVPNVLTDVLNQPADVTFVLDKVLALGTTPGDAFDGILDARHIAAAGHSGGAVTTLLLESQGYADPRITATVVLSGTVDIAGLSAQFVTPGIPTLMEHGTADDTIPIAAARQTYAALPGPKAFVALSGATHSTPYNNRPADDSFPTVLATTTDYLVWALTGDADALTQFRETLDEKKRTTLEDDLG